MLTRRLVTAMLLVALATGASPVAAEPTASEKETARSLLDEGDRSFGRKDYQGALTAYQAADAIMGVPTTSVEVAKVEAVLGLLVEARDSALKVSRFPSAANEPGAFKQARLRAEQLAYQLGQRIPSVRITLRGIVGSNPIALEIDGVAVPNLTAPFAHKVNPGRHVVSASAVGYERKTAEIVVREGETRECEIVLSAQRMATIEPTLPTSKAVGPPVAGFQVGSSEETAPRPTQASSADSDGASSLSSPSERASRTKLVITYVGGAVAGAGLLTGAALGLAELSRVARARTACDYAREVASAPTTSESAELARGECVSAHRAAQSFATATDLVLGAGILGAAVAIFAQLGAPAGEHRTGAVSQASPGFRLPITPILRADGIGVSGRF